MVAKPAQPGDVNMFEDSDSMCSDDGEISDSSMKDNAEEDTKSIPSSDIGDLASLDSEEVMPDCSESVGNKVRKQDQMHVTNEEPLPIQSQNLDSTSSDGGRRNPQDTRDFERPMQRQLQDVAEADRSRANGDEQKDAQLARPMQHDQKVVAQLGRCPFRHWDSQAHELFESGDALVTIFGHTPVLPTFSSEGLTTDDVAKLRSSILENHQNFQAWLDLMNAVEQEGEAAEIEAVYVEFLKIFPLCWGYWKRLANIRSLGNGDKAAFSTYEVAVEIAGSCVDLWIQYCEAVASSSESDDYIRSVFERAVSIVGRDWNSGPLWQQYLDFEQRRKQWRVFGDVLRRALAAPCAAIHDIGMRLNVLMCIEDGPTPLELCSKDEEFEMAAELGCAVTKLLQERSQSTSNGDAACSSEKVSSKEASKPKEHNDEDLEDGEMSDGANLERVRSESKAAKLAGETQGTHDEGELSDGLEEGEIPEEDEEESQHIQGVNDANAYTGDQTHEKNGGQSEKMWQWLLERRRSQHASTLAQVEIIWEYESQLKRAYFLNKPLNLMELDFWRRYLSFEESRVVEDATRLHSLYKRCLVTTNNYLEFWQRYVALHEQNGNLEDAFNLIADACLSGRLQKRCDVIVLWAELAEKRGKTSQARKIMDAALATFARSHVELMMRRVALERRADNLDECERLLAGYVAEATTMSSLCFLTRRYAQFCEFEIGRLDSARNAFLNAWTHGCRDMDLLKDFTSFNMRCYRRERAAQGQSSMDSLQNDAMLRSMALFEEAIESAEKNYTLEETVAVCRCYCDFLRVHGAPIQKLHRVEAFSRVYLASQRASGATKETAKKPKKRPLHEEASDNLTKLAKVCCENAPKPPQLEDSEMIASDDLRETVVAQPCDTKQCVTAPSSSLDVPPTLEISKCAVPKGDPAALSELPFGQDMRTQGYLAEAYEIAPAPPSALETNCDMASVSTATQKIQDQSISENGEVGPALLRAQEIDSEMSSVSSAAQKIEKQADVLETSENKMVSGLPNEKRNSEFPFGPLEQCVPSATKVEKRPDLRDPPERASQKRAASDCSSEHKAKKHADPNEIANTSVTSNVATLQTIQPTEFPKESNGIESDLSQDTQEQLHVMEDGQRALDLSSMHLETLKKANDIETKSPLRQKKQGETEAIEDGEILHSYDSSAAEIHKQESLAEVGQVASISAQVQQTPKEIDMQDGERAMGVRPENIAQTIETPKEVGKEVGEKTQEKTDAMEDGEMDSDEPQEDDICKQESRTEIVEVASALAQMQQKPKEIDMEVVDASSDLAKKMHQHVDLTEDGKIVSGTSSLQRESPKADNDMPAYPASRQKKQEETDAIEDGEIDSDESPVDEMYYQKFASAFSQIQQKSKELHTKEDKRATNQHLENQFQTIDPVTQENKASKEDGKGAVRLSQVQDMLKMSGTDDGVIAMGACPENLTQSIEAPLPQTIEVSGASSAQLESSKEDNDIYAIPSSRQETQEEADAMEDGEIDSDELPEDEISTQKIVSALSQMQQIPEQLDLKGDDQIAMDLSPESMGRKIETPKGAGDAASEKIQKQEYLIEDCKMQADESSLRLESPNDGNDIVVNPASRPEPQEDAMEDGEMDSDESEEDEVCKHNIESALSQMQQMPKQLDPTENGKIIMGLCPGNIEAVKEAGEPASDLAKTRQKQAVLIDRRIASDASSMPDESPKADNGMPANPSSRQEAQEETDAMEDGEIDSDESPDDEMYKQKITSAFSQMQQMTKKLDPKEGGKIPMDQRAKSITQTIEAPKEDGDASSDWAKKMEKRPHWMEDSAVASGTSSLLGDEMVAHPLCREEEGLDTDEDGELHSDESGAEDVHKQQSLRENGRVASALSQVEGMPKECNITEDGEIGSDSPTPSTQESGQKEAGEIGSDDDF